jgi:nucleoside-diphosphate-sugar epimerase
MLIESGHEVVGLDTGYFREDLAYDTKAKRLPQIIDKDTRRIESEDLRGFDAVAHLADLSNDPLGALNPQVTYEINLSATEALADLCRRAGVERFVYSSSCSVYGLSSDDFRTEESDIEPRTAYAKCKMLVERHLRRLADDHFSPVILRNATVYGASPRMRFDLVLNNLAGFAWTTKQIRMTSDGTPWRPLVHVLDVCRAFVCVLESPREAVHNETFNVGDTEHNYRVREIARIVADRFPGCEVTFGKSALDSRSYRVSFDKIHRRLPDFSCRMDPAKGAEQLRAVFEQVQLSREMFESRAYTRLLQLRYLIETGQLDEKLFWVR